MTLQPVPNCKGREQITHRGIERTPEVGCSHASTTCKVAICCLVTLAIKIEILDERWEAHIQGSRIQGYPRIYVSMVMVMLYFIIR